MNEKFIQLQEALNEIAKKILILRQENESLNRDFMQAKEVIARMKQEHAQSIQILEERNRSTKETLDMYVHAIRNLVDKLPPQED